MAAIVRDMPSQSKGEPDSLRIRRYAGKHKQTRSGLFLGDGSGGAVDGLTGLIEQYFPRVKAVVHLVRCGGFIKGELVSQ